MNKITFEEMVKSLGLPVRKQNNSPTAVADRKAEEAAAMLGIQPGIEVDEQFIDMFHEVVSQVVWEGYFEVDDAQPKSLREISENVDVNLQQLLVT